MFGITSVIVKTILKTSSNSIGQFYSLLHNYTSQAECLVHVMDVKLVSFPED